MAEVTLLPRCPTCGQTRAEAAVCECGHLVSSHAIDPHRGTRTVCYRNNDPSVVGGCDCVAYREVDRA